MAMKRTAHPVFLLALVFQIAVEAGYHVSLNTTPDHAHYFLNDLGINVKDKTLVFELTSTQDAIIRLAKSQTLAGTYCDVIYGSSSNTAIAVRESCSGCSSFLVASGTFLSTTTAASFWLDWSDALTLKSGQGSIVGQTTLFSYTWQVQFEVNYLSATSYYSQQGQWSFLIDTPPYFTYPKQDGTSVIFAAENVPINDSIIIMSVSDDESDVVTSSVIGQHSTMFTIDGNNVRVTEQLDFESQPWFSIMISATDGRYNTTSSFILMVTDINDETPVLTPGSVTSVLEEQPIGTYVMGLYAVEDGDKGDTLNFSLQGNHSAYFTINETSGEIAVAQRLDREAGLATLDDLWLEVKDDAQHVATLRLLLAVSDVNDNAPRFEPDLYFVNVSTANAPNVPLLTFNISDADEGGSGNSNVSLSLLASQQGFWISATHLYVNVSQLDQSVQSVYTLAVQASDGGAHERVALTSVAVVNVQMIASNDYAPTWVHPTRNFSGWFPELSVSEDAALGTTLLFLSAADDDFGSFGDVTYAITSAVSDTGSNSSHLFFLDPVSGCLRTTSVLDRDAAFGGSLFHLLTLQVSDSGSRSSEAKLQITLTGVNDNTPIFNQNIYRVDLLCDRPIGTSLLTVVASDADDVSALAYSFLPNGSDYFVIDRVSGEVSLKTNVSVVAAASHTHVVAVSVSDGVAQEMTSYAVIVIEIADEDCHVAASNATNGPANSELTNTILIAACGLLGAGFLFSVCLLCVKKANHTAPANTLNKTQVSTNIWTKRNTPPCSAVTGFTTVPDGSSRDTQLSECSSYTSLRLV